VVYEAVVVPWVLWTGRSQLKLRNLIELGLAGLAGLSPYVLLFVSQTIGLAKYSWGDLLSFHGYYVHLSRQEYGSFQLYKGQYERTPQITSMLTYFAADGDQSDAPSFATKVLFYIQDLRADVGSS